MSVKLYVASWAMRGQMENINMNKTDQIQIFYLNSASLDGYFLAHNWCLVEYSSIGCSAGHQLCKS